MGNFYESESFPEIEKVIAAEDIIIGNNLGDLRGKFFFPVMSPGFSIKEEKSTHKQAPTTGNQKGQKLSPKDYYEVNYIIIKIPKQFVLYFLIEEYWSEAYQSYYIPKGKIFTISMIGGEAKLDKIEITGVSAADGLGTSEYDYSSNRTTTRTGYFSGYNTENNLMHDRVVHENEIKTGSFDTMLSSVKVDTSDFWEELGGSDD